MDDCNRSCSKPTIRRRITMFKGVEKRNQFLHDGGRSVISSWHNVANDEMCRDGLVRKIMAEVHEGVYSSHIGGRLLAIKVLREGFYLPPLKKDCLEYVKKCSKCQIYADLHITVDYHDLALAICNVESGYLGSFSNLKRKKEIYNSGGELFCKVDRGKNTSDYYSSKDQKKKNWKRIVCRFGVPLALVTDNDTQFTSNLTRDFCEDLEIQMRFASVENPQTNGQAESVNKVILNGLKR